MPTWLEIALAVLLGLIVALAFGGSLAARLRHRRAAHAFAGSLDVADRALAAAHAQDKGWEPEALRATARRLFEAQRPGIAIREQALVQVIDEPGTEADKAVFRFVTDAGESQLTLGRHGGEWVGDSLS